MKHSYDSILIYTKYLYIRQEVPVEKGGKKIGETLK